MADSGRLCAGFGAVLTFLVKPAATALVPGCLAAANDRRKFARLKALIIVGLVGCSL
jgi:hypothetical protein